MSIIEKSSSSSSSSLHREIDPLLKDLSEKKQSFRRNVVSLAEELKLVRSRLAHQEQSFAKETLTRQEAESKAKKMEEEISRLQRSLEVRSGQLQLSASTAEKYLKDMDDLKSQLSETRATAEASLASAESAEIQRKILLKELDEKNSSLKEHEARVNKLGEQLDNLQKDLQAREYSQKQLKDEVLRIEHDIMEALAKAGESKDCELRKILDEVSPRNFLNINKILMAKDEELARLRDEIRVMSAHWKLKTQELESQLEKHKRADQELKKRVLKLEFCLQEARSQTRKLQRMNSSSSAASNSTTPSTTSSTEKLKPSDDLAWEFGVQVHPGNTQHLRCILCLKEMRGGVSRLKQHIANIPGSVSGCPKSTKEDQLKCRDGLNSVRTKKAEKRKHELNVRSEVQIDAIDEEDEEEAEGSRKNPHFLGPMDKFATKIDTKSKGQSNLNESILKERTHSVHQLLARWIYESGIPFNAIDNDSFRRFCEGVGQFGPSYKPPSQYLLREPLLKEEVERTKKLLMKHEEEWKVNGCSIMTDAWSDRKRRSVMNLCVNCKEGTTFVSSREDSESAHTGDYIFKYVDNIIDEIGPQYVVQVVTDNATNNMAAAGFLKAKRPKIFWTSCATHTINLMLEGIGKQPKFKALIDKAKALTIFIYAHTKTLSMMRNFTQKKDIVRPGVTRFATSFLTLQSLMEKREKLKLMFASKDWEDCKWSKVAKGKVSSTTVLSLSFWNSMSLCLKVFAPLVKVLRLADGDRKPAMGFMYGELQQARKDIKEAFNNIETNYLPILAIIDTKSNGRLDSPLHLAGYLLNPYYYFKDVNIQKDQVVMEGFLTCVETFFKDDCDMQQKVSNVELWKYLQKDGTFGKQMASSGCTKNDDNFDPVGWWTIYGNGVPNLQSMALKILSLTTSSSGCERNWSTFEGIHTKKRNRLDSTRLNNLVYVQFNSKLLNKKKRANEKNMDVLLANDASNAQGWMVEGGESEESLEDNRHVVRELNDLEFISDEESEDEVNEVYDFESDGDTVMDG